MNHGAVLRRAWQILRRYRALWIFGVILALTTAGSANLSSSSNWKTNENEVSQASGINIYTGDDGKLHVDWGDTQELETFFKEDWPEFQQSFETWIEAHTAADFKRTAITIGIIFGAVVLVLSILAAIGRYVAETALIRMVDDYEDSGEPLTVRQGFRLGWSRMAWRLFLINLVIDLPLMFGILTLLACVAAPALLWLSGNMVAGVVGTVAAIGLGFIAILFLIVVVVVVNLVKQFARRLCVLEDRGVMASIRGGWEMLRHYLKEIGLMWLITVAIKAAFPLAMIPLAFVAFVAALVIGGGLGLAAGGLSALFTGGVASWVIGGTTGIVIAILVLAIPLVFLEGLREVYLSSTWTLTYRELRLLGDLTPDAPLDDAPLRDAPQAA